MPQTTKGAANNEWVTFLRKCASDFHAQKKQAPQATRIERRVQADNQRAGEQHRRVVEQQATSAVRSAQAAEGERKAIQARERRRKQAELEQRKTQKKRAKAVVKQVKSSS